MLPSQKEDIMSSLKKEKKQQESITLYALLWHSEGGFCYYESAKTEKPTKEEAERVLKEWLNKRMKNCKNNKCEHDAFIFSESEVTPKMRLAGITIKNIVEI